MDTIILNYISFGHLFFTLSNMGLILISSVPLLLAYSSEFSRQESLDQLPLETFNAHRCSWCLSSFFLLRFPFWDRVFLCSTCWLQTPANFLPSGSWLLELGVWASGPSLWRLSERIKRGAFHTQMKTTVLYLKFRTVGHLCVYVSMYYVCMYVCEHTHIAHVEGWCIKLHNESWQGNSG